MNAIKTDLLAILKRVEAKLEILKHPGHPDQSIHGNWAHDGDLSNRESGKGRDLAAGHPDHDMKIPRAVQPTLAQREEYGSYMKDVLNIDTSDLGPFPHRPKGEKNKAKLEEYKNKLQDWTDKAEQKALAMFEKNADDLWQTLDEKNLQDGKEWYMKAHLFGTEIAKEFNVSTETAIGILAALSPQLEWASDDKVDTRERRRSKMHNQGQAIRVLEVMTGQHGNGLIIPTETAAETVNKQRAGLDEADARAREKQRALGKPETGLKGIDKRKLNVLDARSYNGKYDEYHGQDFTTPKAFIKRPHEGRLISDLPADILAQMHPELEGLRPNIEKGIRFFRGDSADDILGGPKVRSFYNNMLNPHHSDDVTVDTHMVRALMGDDGMGHRGNNLKPIKGENVSDYIGNDAQYELFSRAIKSFAKKHGLRNHEAQAVLWLLQKKRGRVLPDRQPREDGTQGRGIPTNIGV